MSEERSWADSNKEFRRLFYRDIYFEAFSNQAQYGRWILASLLAVHAGGLLAISQSGESASKLFAACGPYLLWGLTAALASGGAAWINFTAAMKFYSKALKVAMEGDKLEPSGPLLWIVNATVWGAPLGAIASLALFVLAARTALTPH